MTSDKCAIKFGRFKAGELFKAIPIKSKISTQDLVQKGYPAYSSDTSNGGIIGYVDVPEFKVEENKCYVIFGDHTRSLNIATRDFSVLDNVKVLVPPTYNINALLYMFSIWKKAIPIRGMLDIGEMLRSVSCIYL